MHNLLKILFDYIRGQPKVPSSKYHALKDEDKENIKG